MRWNRSLTDRAYKALRHGLSFMLVGLFLFAAVREAAAATPEQYDAALGRVSQAITGAVEALEADAVPEPPPSQAALRHLLPIKRVERPGREAVVVNNDHLWKALMAAEKQDDTDRKLKDLAALQAQIIALQQSVRQASRLAPEASSPKAPPEADPVSVARAVLAQPVYGSDPLPPPSAFEQQVNRFFRWLSDLWSRLFGSQQKKPPAPMPVNPDFARVLLILLIIGVIALLVWVLLGQYQRRSARAVPIALDDAEAALVEARDTDTLLALADRHAQTGDYRRAFRLVYVATLIGLDTTGVLRFDRSKTNWEYLRALRAAGRADVYEAMLPLTREFDRLWYGLAPADAADYMRAVAQYKALQIRPAAALT